MLFGGCINLTSATIPTSVTAIGDSAFIDCRGLKSIICQNPVPSKIILGNGVFYNVNKTTCILKVPIGSAAAYQIAAQWQDFIIIEEIATVVFTQISADICEGDSYSFKGEDLTDAGVYYDTLTALTGYDSIVELTLTVNPTYFTKISDSISAGSSYIFNGKTLTTAGIYYDTLKTTHGCDSVFELTLTISTVGIPTITNYGLRIFPNPTDGKITIHISQFTFHDIEIYDVVAQVVGAYCIRPETKETIIDISHLAGGMYYLKIAGKLVKFVKE